MKAVVCSQHWCQAKCNGSRQKRQNLCVVSGSINNKVEFKPKFYWYSLINSFKYKHARSLHTPFVTMDVINIGILNI